MGRPAKFDRDTLLDATGSLIATHGLAAVTVAGLARQSGASTGSIYHLFPSLSLLVAEVWVRTVERFQIGFVRALESDDDTLAAAIAAARYTPRWSRGHLDDARVLLLHRREELAARFPRELGSRLEGTRLQGRAALGSFVRRHFARTTSRAMQIATFALIDVPYGAVRRHLVAGRAPPRAVDDLVAQACAAVLTRTPGRRGR